jgi:hypothetical protein
MDTSQSSHSQPNVDGQTDQTDLDFPLSGDLSVEACLGRVSDWMRTEAGAEVARSMAATDVPARQRPGVGARRSAEIFGLAPATIARIRAEVEKLKGGRGFLPTGTTRSAADPWFADMGVDLPPLPTDHGGAGAAGEIVASGPFLYRSRTRVSEDGYYWFDLLPPPPFSPASAAAGGKAESASQPPAPPADPTVGREVEPEPVEVFLTWNYWVLCQGDRTIACRDNSDVDPDQARSWACDVLGVDPGFQPARFSGDFSLPEAVWTAPATDVPARHPVVAVRFVSNWAPAEPAEPVVPAAAAKSVGNGTRRPSAVGRGRPRA